MQTFEYNIAKEIQKNGVYFQKKILKDDIVTKFKKGLNSIKAYEKGNNNGIFSLNFKQLLKNLLIFNFNKFYYSIFFIYFAKKNKFKNCADIILGEESKLIKLDSYISKISDKEIIEWHCDQAHSGSKNVKKENLTHPDKGLIKFFIFLTPVKSNNGCLAYIKGSHKITKSIKKAIFYNDIIYRPFWSIFDLRLIVKKYNKNILNKYCEEKNFQNFLNKTNAFEISKDTLKFDNQLQAGDMMIFDELGVHRAAKPSKQDRYVIRFIYGRKRLY